MNRIYIEYLVDCIPAERRKKILYSSKIKGSIPGFSKRIDLAPLGKLKSTLKKDEKFAAQFLDAVADEYDCSPEQHADEKQLPKLTYENFEGLFARKCKELDASEKSDKILEQMVQEYEKLLPSDLSNDKEDVMALSAISADLEQEDFKASDNNTDEQPNIGFTDKGEDYMSEGTQYIGYVQEINGFYNFWPVCIVNPDSIEEFYDAKSYFPEYGNINLYSQEKRYIEKQLHDEDLVVLTLVDSDLEANLRWDGDLQRTNYKIDLKKLEQQSRVKRLVDINVYPVLHFDNQIDFTKKKIIVKGQYVNEKDLCLIEEGVTLYGPYEVKSEEDGFYVNLPNNYIVDSFRPKSGKLDNINIDIPDSVDYYNQMIRIIRVDDKLISEPLDKISDQELFKAFLSSLESRKNHSKNEITTDLVDEYAKSTFRGVPDKIIQERVQRIKQFIKEQFQHEASLKDISRFVADVLYQYGEEDYFSNLLEHVLDNSELARKIQSFAIVEQRLEDMQSQYKALQKECEEERRTWEEEKRDHKRQINELASNTSDEIRKLNSEKEDLEKEIEAIRGQKEQWKKFEDLSKEKEFLERQINEYRDKTREHQAACTEAEKSYKQKQGELETELKRTLNNAASNTINAAFDGKIAEQVLQAAAKWNQMTQDDDFKRVAAVLADANDNSTVSRDELAEYLFNSVQYYRPKYSRNDILNIFLCITQNFLTVFSGEPGTGKTSISNIVAHILGTSKIKDNVPKENGIELSRYVPISIERGWTSKRDFIGYYNPLSQTFEQANKHLYDGLRLLDAEGEQSKYPYIVLLDEANLSPIEYYWADFMNLCDSDSRFSKITLGNDIQLRIPSTLRFVATINNDDTTERLSPRLIDRAALIRLPDVPYEKIEDENLTDTSFVNVVEWADLQAVFAPETSLDLDSMPNSIYQDICTLFRENMKLSVSPRVDHSIRRYWAVAKGLFENEAGNDKTIIALDYAVAQKLLPKINGSGKAYSEFLGKLQELCEKNNLEKSRAILMNIIERGEASMNYYQYF